MLEDVLEAVSFIVHIIFHKRFCFELYDLFISTFLLAMLEAVLEAVSVIVQLIFHKQDKLPDSFRLPFVLIQAMLKDVAGHSVILKAI